MAAEEIKAGPPPLLADCGRQQTDVMGEED
jgi:hypothetical protein